MDEHDLLRLLQQGNHSAFHQIYHRYKHRMAGNLLRMLKSQDLAEEALQELFVRIWTNREKLDINQPIRPYMFRIAKNLVFDLYRRAARDQHLREKMLEAMGSSYSHIEEGICF